MSLSMISRNGDLHPPATIQMWWGLVLGVVAAALLVAGGLIALQTAAIMTAFPFSLIMLLIAYGLLHTLWQFAADPIASPQAKEGERSRQ
jgi:choline-glycine betaine transporter